VSIVLREEKKQQVITLGRLAWALRRIEATHISAERQVGELSPPQNHKERSFLSCKDAALALRDLKLSARISA
jgi:hypothetical protein